MIRLISHRTIYEGWLDLVIATFSGPDGDFDRHIVKMGEAVAVLPYDPARGVALAVSMPRAAVAFLGQPDMLEAIAGMVDTADPEICARRESLEEGGVALGTLEFVGRYWSMPSASTERIAYYLAPYAEADRVAAGGGAEGEDEHITVHELPLAALWRDHEAGALLDIKLVTLLTALRLRHPELFAA